MGRLFFLVMTCLVSLAAGAEQIVIMHTNDTHSQIDPAADGTGGIARRKVLIDSIRATHANTLLIDAGDAVQGTVYFNLYGGEVEAKALNAMGYDFVMLGNHEFDNGMEALAQYMKSVKAPYISTNYDVSGSPLEGLIERYRIVDIAGKRIGLIGLNVNPDGIIDPTKSEGVKYQDVYRAANSTAWHLKHNEGVDYVVAMSHIGYDYDDMPDDVEVADEGYDIDLIIGGHSHTVIQPGSAEGILTNADGKPVVVTQTGNSGKYLGVVTIDTDTGAITTELLPVTGRLDNRVDPAITEMLAPYRHGVDSLKSIVIGKTQINTDDRKNEALINFVSDFTASRGNELSQEKPIDLAIANRGGVRTGMRAGNVTKGMILEMLPFENHVVVLELSGADLLDALGTSARTGRVSFDRQVVVTMDDEKVEKATIDGKAVLPEKTYRIATIDYLATGGDYMQPLTRGKEVTRSNNIMNEDAMDYISRLSRRTIKSDTTKRLTLK